MTATKTIGFLAIAGGMVAILSLLASFFGATNSLTSKAHVIATLACFIGSAAFLICAWRDDRRGIPTPLRQVFLAWYAFIITGMWVGVAVFINALWTN